MKNKHKLTTWLDQFYKIVASSCQFWWTLLKNGLIYGGLDGIYKMKFPNSKHLKLSNKKFLSFIWSILIILTMTCYQLISPKRDFMAIIFISLFILTLFVTIYLYQIVEVIALNEKMLSDEEIYAQAFVRIWYQLFLKIAFLIIGVLVAKLNLIIFICCLPKIYSIIINKLAKTQKLL
ncbi:hypothetical protein Hs30E_19610 [Lactococcus hodotermopsidis]|uniref:DUF624 domain-containing protein n=1 Tax=Pseudolactococcus hodotermopsidis TaxID=2709157 RepID=A0A6A0BD91_9LACT|nr:hypothetical protein [Lactococcus hodotermopsidis]GFH43410.1 hypothetical protein Hs30E_19610 [Lactococcus hodotermopsidis]